MVQFIIIISFFISCKNGEPYLFEPYIQFNPESLSKEKLKHISKTINRDLEVNLSLYIPEDKIFKEIKDIKNPFHSVIVIESKAEYDDIKLNKKNYTFEGTKERTITNKSEFKIDTVQNRILYSNDLTDQKQESSLQKFYDYQSLNTTSNKIYFKRGAILNASQDSLITFTNDLKRGKYISKIAHLDSNKNVIGIDYFSNSINSRGEPKLSLSRKFILNEHELRKELYVFDNTAGKALEGKSTYIYNKLLLLTQEISEDIKPKSIKPSSYNYLYKFYKTEKSNKIKVDVTNEKDNKIKTIEFDHKLNWISIQTYGLYKEKTERIINYR